MTVDISIIIPVLFEQDAINPALDSLWFSNASYQWEIIVADGDPMGGTIRAIERGDVITLTAPVGRGAQMNAGARRAGGRILLFLHADTRLPANAVERVISVCQDERVAGGAFDLSIASSHPMLKIIARMASLRSRLTRIPYGDQAIFIKKSIFMAANGFADIPIMEDIELMRRLRRNGYRIRILEDRVTTSARRWQKEGIWYASLRNIVISTLYYAGVSPARLKRFYRWCYPGDDFNN
jgi:rSAM/selenodomain-associated transferase 2